MEAWESFALLPWRWCCAGSTLEQELDWSPSFAIGPAMHPLWCWSCGFAAPSRSSVWIMEAFMPIGTVRARSKSTKRDGVWSRRRQRLFNHWARSNIGPVLDEISVASTTGTCNSDIRGRNAFRLKLNSFGRALFGSTPMSRNLWPGGHFTLFASIFHLPNQVKRHMKWLRYDRQSKYVIERSKVCSFERQI